MIPAQSNLQSQSYSDELASDVLAEAGESTDQQLFLKVRFFLLMKTQRQRSPNMVKHLTGQGVFWVEKMVIKQRNFMRFVVT